jgi:hypothetical protein
VRSENECKNVVALGAVAFVLEDARRTAPVPDGRSAVVLPQFQSPQSATDSRFRPESGRLRLLEARPLVTTLRI